VSGKERDGQRERDEGRECHGRVIKIERFNLKIITKNQKTTKNNMFATVYNCFYEDTD
jgi:hypothetical protein